MINPIIEHQTWHRWVLYVAFILAAGAAGYYQGKGTAEVRVVEHAAKTLIEYKDRIVTVTKTIRPDGTVTETTKTEDREKSVDSTVTDKSTVTIPVASNYSLGVRYQSAYFELISQAISNPYKGLEVSAGRRILGPLWLEVGAGIERITLGVRYEF